MKNKNLLILGIAIAILILLGLFLRFPTQSPDTTTINQSEIISPANWRNIAIKDVSTGDTFKISDFKNKFQS